MIIYNTLMGVCAGLGMITVADSLRLFRLGGSGIIPRSHGFALVILGTPLTLLALLMATTWPLNAEPPVNIAFAEPSVLLGLLMVTAGIVFITNFDEDDWPTAAMWVVFVLGLVLASISSAIFSYGIIGDAPPEEPITSRVTGWEQTTFGVVYAVAALGCLLAQWARHRVVFVIVWGSWVLAGVFFLLFSVLNYRTHLGLLTNFGTGTHYRW